MAAERYALVRAGVVENVILYDPAGTYTPPVGATLVRSDTANPGDTYDGVVFTRPVAAAPNPIFDEFAKVRAFKSNADVVALIAADPATLNTAQKIARGQAIAFLALVKIVRSDLAE